MSENGGGPLAGLRVVEFAGIGPGPFAGMLLADLGAQVVRVERPEDPPPPAAEVLTRNRLRVRANLKDPTQRDEVLRLLDRADALIEGFRPAVMERLGLGPDIVLERNPRIVYGRMTGWGQTGPRAQSAGHDINYIAITGALDAIGTAEHSVPPLNLVGDYGGGAMYLLLGMLSALLAVKNGKPGQVVDAAICDGVASLMAVFTELRAAGEWRDRRCSNFLDGAAPYYRTYVCADGGLVSVGALEPGFYLRLCELIGFPESSIEYRDDVSAWPALSTKLAAHFLTRNRDEWERLLDGTDACFSPVRTLGEAARDPHLVARKTFIEHQGIMQPAPAPRFSRTPALHPQASRETEITTVLTAWS